MQHRFPVAELLFRTVGRDRPTGRTVIDCDPRRIDDPESVVETIIPEFRQGGVQHVPAEREVRVGDPQLCEKRRREVALGGVCFDNRRLPYRAAKPQHRNAVAQHVAVADTIRIGIGVVGDEDDQQVVPYGRLFHPPDETAQTVIHKGHRIEHRVIESLYGDVERFMARQRQHRGEKRRGVVGFGKNVFREGLHDHIVGVAPFRCRCVEMQILLPDQPVEARSIEVGGGIREVEVAAVHETCRIAPVAQRPGNRGEPLALDREFHDRHLGLCGESAQYGDRPAVGAERIGEKVVKIDPFGFQLPEVRCNRFAIDRFIGRRSAETLYQKEHDVGTLRPQQRVGRRSRRTVAAQALNVFGQFLLRIEFVFEELLVAGCSGREKGEERIDRGMVQEHLSAEIDFRDVGRCYGDSAPNCKKEQSGRQQQDGGESCPMPLRGLRIEKPRRTEVAEGIQGKDGQRDGEICGQLSGGDARHRLLG